MPALTEAQALTAAAALIAVVRDFDLDPVSSRQRIREFLQYAPGSFCRTAIGALNREGESNAAQYLVSLLVSENLLFGVLCDPALARERVLPIARRALRIDPMIDATLARQLADAEVWPGDPMAERLLETLDEISNGNRIQPSLMRLLRKDDPRLRSKAVLMIGRRGQSVNWIQRRLQESDPRVRANAIEAIWETDTAESRELLTWAARDSNNRVVGNALFGLYKLGEVSAISELVKMASHPSENFRRTAAWVMGKTGDPRFCESVGRMIADQNGSVRKSAFQAMGRLRAAAAQLSEGGELTVAGMMLPGNPRTGQIRIAIGAAARDSLVFARILPVQFQLSENGETVWSYEVHEKLAPEPLAVSFLFPRTTALPGWDQAAVSCLKWKRSLDLWAAIPYTGADEAAGSPDLQLPSFISNSAQADRVFEKTPKRLDCTGFWAAIRRAGMSGRGHGPAKRHLIVLAPDKVDGQADNDLVAAVHASRMSVQVICGAENSVLREFCGRINGNYHLLTAGQSIEERISLIYLGLLARYEIRFMPLTKAGSLKVRVHTPSGWGETVLSFGTPDR